MNSLFLFLFFSDLAFILIFSSVDGFVLLLLVIPWTLLIYLVLCFKGLKFFSTDHLQQLAGKLYLIGQGTFYATGIAIINVILGVLIIPNSSLAQFEQLFGPFSSILVFMILPLPGFFIISFQREDQERLYGLIYQTMIQKEETPEFIELTSTLLTKTERYTEEYTNQVGKIRDFSYQYLEQNFPNIAIYFEQKHSFRLNLENLAIFLTKKAITPEI